IGNQMSVNPGPLGSGSSRPSWKTTARSYSFRILTLRKIQNATTKRAKTGTLSRAPNTAPFMPTSASPAGDSPNLLHVHHQVVNPDDPHARALGDPGARPRVPVFPVHEHPALRIDVGQRHPLLVEEPARSGHGTEPPDARDQPGE